MSPEKHGFTKKKEKNDLLRKTVAYLLRLLRQIDLVITHTGSSKETKIELIIQHNTYWLQ